MAAGLLARPRGLLGRVRKGATVAREVWGVGSGAGGGVLATSTPRETGESPTV